MVVSNIDLATDLPKIRPTAFLESALQDSTLNINTDYRYLKTGYYVSLHAEVLGNPVIPTSENSIDAYRTPILLLRASKAGIPILPYLVTDSVKQIIDELGFPIVVFPVNPFVFDGFKTAKNRSALYRAVKSLGMNYKFDVCAQPLRGEMISFKSIFGKCDVEGEPRAISTEVYRVFRIPICRLHVQVSDGKAYLGGLQPLRKGELTQEDLEAVAEEISQISNNGEPIIG